MNDEATNRELSESTVELLRALADSEKALLDITFRMFLTCPPKTDPSAMRVPTGPGWALETLDETDTTHT
jgi:hypothetical protein